MRGKKAIFEKFISLFQKRHYEDLLSLVDPKFSWELKGIPAWKGKYNLKKMLALYGRLQRTADIKMHVKLQRLIFADKYAVAHLSQSVKEYGQLHTIDAIWMMELNRSGNKLLRIQSFLLASPEIQSYAEMLKAAA